MRGARLPRPGRTIAAAALAVAIAALACGPAAAGQFRRPAPIAKPEPPPPGFQAVAEPVVIPRALIESAVRQVFDAWNTGDLRDHLSDRFFDKDRLMDQIFETAPRDAKVRLLGLQSVQLLGQFEGGADEAGRLIVAKLSAIARTAVEFNNAENGFVRLEGLHEYLFTMTVRAPK